MLIELNLNYLEALLKRTIKDNYQTFVRSTNFTSLAHLLKQYSLINDTEYSKLEGVDSQLHGNEKANYFYLELLGTKGNMAYTLFWYCLTLETGHLGHKELLDLLNKAVEEVEKEREGEEDGRAVNEWRGSVCNAGIYIYI